MPGSASSGAISRLVRVERGQQGGSGRGADGTRTFHQVFLERPADDDAGFGQQRRDQPAGADRRLEHQGHRAAGPGERLGHGLQPDGRTVDQVQVDVTVDKRPGGQR